MLIKMLSEFVGERFSLEIGHIYDRPDAEAIRMIERGHAIPVRDIPIETTASSPPVVRNGVSAGERTEPYASGRGRGKGKRTSPRG